MDPDGQIERRLMEMEKTTEEAIRLWIKTASLEEFKRLLEMLWAELNSRAIFFDYTLGSP